MVANYKDVTPGQRRKLSAKIWVSEVTRKHREQVAAEKAKRDQRLKEQKEACRANVKKKQEEARQQFRDAVLRERAIRNLAVEGAREECQLEAKAILKEEKTRLKALAEEKRLKVAQRRDLDRKTPRDPMQFRKAADRKLEANEEVEGNVAAEDYRLVPVWKAWKRNFQSIKSPHTRFEKFMLAVHNAGGVNAPELQAIWGEEHDPDQIAREAEAHYAQWGAEIEGRKAAHRKKMGRASSTLTPF